MKYVSSYLVLLVSCSCLAKVETADIPISLGRLESPFTETSFHVGRFHLLLDEVDLGSKALALLIHRSVPVDLGHKSPIISRELVEGMMEGSEGGTTSHQCREEPDGECPWRVIVIVVIVLLRGVKVHDEGEISWGIVI